jgi:hypothetical protein
MNLHSIQKEERKKNNNKSYLRTQRLRAVWYVFSSVSKKKITRAI